MNPRYCILILMCFGQYALCQSGIHNYGNLQLHQNGSLGFHTDFANYSGFDNNQGLIGFYHPTETLEIGGAFSPSFHELELGVENGLNLDISIEITEELNFIYGDILTDKKRKNIDVKFLEKSGFNGVSELTKINGRAAVDGQKSFEFPVGDSDMLRPLTIQFVDEVFLAKCAYHLENPDNPKSFASSFDTRKINTELSAICPQEFWNLNTSGRVLLSLSWNAQSNMEFYTDDIENITVAGWSKVRKTWENLGNSKLEGDMGEGSVMSQIFNANDYEIFTFGFLNDFDKDEPGNYAITPNGDGINDSFVLKIIEQSPNNDLRIFNRAGLLVFAKTNYKNEFKGYSNQNPFPDKGPLPEGVYFYLLDLKDLNKQYQGYFYLQAE